MLYSNQNIHAGPVGVACCSAGFNQSDNGKGSQLLQQTRASILYHMHVHQGQTAARSWRLEKQLNKYLIRNWGKTKDFYFFLIPQYCSKMKNRTWKVLETLNLIKFQFCKKC